MIITVRTEDKGSRSFIKMALKGAFNFTQIRALLWKDLIVRARQPVSYKSLFVQQCHYLLIYINMD